jgi:ATP-dependent exoDNAse (exonuclease V) alpha subunit
MIRLQFPLKLGNKCIYFNDKVLSHNNNITHIAYAFTVHKVQGQTVQKLLFDARESVFSHGGLYVALSRVTNSNNIFVSAFSNKIRNIVFTEIFNLILQ